MQEQLLFCKIKRIEVEFICGTDINTAAHSMVIMSRKRRCTVTTNFNGVELQATENDTASTIENTFHNELDKLKPHEPETEDLTL